MASPNEPDYFTPVVIDAGSANIRCGFATEATPRSIFPNVTGYAMSKGEFYVGSEAHKRRSTLAIRHPIQYGVVTNWEDMEKVWKHVFENELKIDPNNHQIFITEPPLNPKADREKLVQIMFEKFNAHSVYIGCQPVLSLYASGYLTGTVLESGESVTASVPISEGFAIKKNIVRLEFGGRHLTNYVTKLLTHDKLVSQKEAHKDTMNDIKEKLCYVAFDYEKELQSSVQSDPLSYDLPDGRVVRINTQRFKCTEALYNPSLLGLELPGIHKTIQTAVNNCDEEIRRSLYENIVLAGGNTLFRGYEDRLRKELTLLESSKMKMKILASFDRIESSWAGGAVAASSSSFEQMWISKKEYEEDGAEIVHIKCQ